MGKMWKTEKERLVSQNEPFRLRTDCFMEELHQTQPLESPRKGRSKTLPLQIMPDRLQDQDNVPDKP